MSSDLEAWFQNSLLYGHTRVCYDKLEHVKNAETRVLTQTRNWDQITLVYIDLYWLLVRECEEVMVLWFTYKAFQGTTYVSLWLCDGEENCGEVTQITRTIPPQGAYDQASHCWRLLLQQEICGMLWHQSLHQLWVCSKQYWKHICSVQYVDPTKWF